MLRALSNWFRRHTPHSNAGKVGRVWLFNDEFTNYNDVEAGMAVIELLECLGYTVEIPNHVESGRSWLSKGFVRKAKIIINKNLRTLTPIVTEACPLIGIEPSAILTFRDEALDLVDTDLKEQARGMASHCLMFEEFIDRELKAGRISPNAFSNEARTIHLHGHCFQKALAGTTASVSALSLPVNYSVKVIPSGCCGMAGSFGYEREHYEVSKNIAGLVLIPALEAISESDLVAAPGTSCRHQIKDFSKNRAYHPAQILRNALKDNL